MFLKILLWPSCGELTAEGGRGSLEAPAGARGGGDGGSGRVGAEGTEGGGQTPGEATAGVGWETHLLLEADNGWGSLVGGGRIKPQCHAVVLSKLATSLPGGVLQATGYINVETQEASSEGWGLSPSA